MTEGYHSDVGGLCSGLEKMQSLLGFQLLLLQPVFSSKAEGLENFS